MNFKFLKPSIAIAVIVAVIVTGVTGLITKLVTSLPEGYVELITDRIKDIGIPVVSAVAVALGYLFGRNNDSDDKLEVLRTQREVITERMSSEKEPDIFNIIQLSLNQIQEYYTINKGQATTSFIFSIVSISLGLAVIITGIVLNYSGTKTIEVTYIAGIAGTLLEFIGGASFLMYKKSLDQVNFFFAQLIKIQDTMLSIELAKQMTEVEKKADMQEKIIVSLLERSLK